MKATLELLDAIEKCLQLNRDERLMGMQKQTVKKIDIHAYMKRQGFDVSYSTVKCVTSYLENRYEEAFNWHEYMLGDICEFDLGTVKLDIDNQEYQKYQMAVFTSAYGKFRFAKLYLAQDIIIFQKSHADFFSYIHGTFQTMLHDNMKVAVWGWFSGGNSDMTNADCPFLIEASIDDLNIRKGAGTNTAKTGVYTGKSVFSILEIRE